ncbi:MAG: amino acid adenylation domain-containing protein, partial [Caldilineaceae bacterium]|nr:amino acid adenylation domain-containing protein [Caldilineaceae bacterium]
RQILVDWNDTQSDYPAHKSIHQLFEEQVERAPNKIAVDFDGEQLTYRELNTRANQLAHYLQALGVGAGSLVGICVERSLDMVVGMLGILKVGGAYLPLDPSYPSERLAFMIHDASVSVLLSQAHLLDSLPQSSIHTICLDTNWAGIATHRDENLAVPVKSENLAYVIYTSGSTGQPKGILVPHLGINRLINNTNYIEIQPSDRIAQLSNASFDAATFEIWGALIHGATLIGVDRETSLSPLELAQKLQQDKITILFQTTALFNQMVNLVPDIFRSLRYVLFGGEAVDPAPVRKLLQAGGPEKLLHVYGPTESTTYSTWYSVQEVSEIATTIPIGGPIANTQVYILDQHLQPVPVGVPGELHIGGDGLASGYLNRPALTAEKFISFPSSITPDKEDTSEQRLYKTGDLVRWLPDGNIEFLGRIDNQVKLRGFRIELGEIEAMLSQHAMVQQAAVILDEKEGHKQLVAYIVLHPTALRPDGKMAAEESSLAELRIFLQGKLPEYMVPNLFMILERFPLTPNGKVDHRALPKPDNAELVGRNEFVSPETKTEELLATIWAEVLGVKQVGRFDNFFELGGDSIISLQVISRAQAKGIHLTPRQLFEAQTIVDLAGVAQQESTVQAEQGLVTGELPLTPIQHWFFERYESRPHHFNQSVLLPVTQEIEPELLLQTIGVLLAHHDGLRLRFTPGEHGWQQRLSDELPELIISCCADYAQATLRPTEIVSVFNLSTVAEPQSALEVINHKLQASLNITDGPLMRVALIQMGPDQDDLLLWVIHHLAVDLVSWRLLIPDLWAVYEQLEQGQTPQLAAKSSSVKTWAAWLSEYAYSETLQTELAHWQKGREEINSLPIDKGDRQEHNAVASAATIETALTVAETQALLQDVPAVYHTQVNDILLTAVTLAFAQWTGNKTLLLDLEGHGRDGLSDALDLSRTVGWFTAAYPVSLQLPAASLAHNGLGEVLKTIKEQLRQIPNKGVGYGLLRYLNETNGKQLSSLPQAEVSFNYGGQFQGSEMQSLGGEWAAELPLSHLISINGLVANQQLSMTWSYSQNLYEPETIEELAKGFISALRDLIAHCLSPEAGGYSPSDFPLLQLNQAQLDHIVGRGENVTQMYPLAPMQAGMLFHTLYTPNDGAYLQQIGFHLRGALDVVRFQQAWEGLLNRHPILRTGFVWQGVDTPLQVVYKDLTLAWDIQDWRGLSSSVQESELSNLLAKERAKGFDLNQPPLMRFSLLRLGDTHYQFVWHFHHLLLDGWSMAILFGELFALYKENTATLP